MFHSFLVIVLVILVVYAIGSVSHRRRMRVKQIEYEAVRSEEVNPEDNFNTIFVSIPCYHDEEECAKTLFSLFNEADSPWRVTVGILHHTEARGKLEEMASSILNVYEQICIAKDATSFSDQIRILVRPCDEAQGPMVARAVIEKTLFQGERFYMTIDSTLG